MKTIEQALNEVDEWDDEVLVGQLFSVASGRHAAKNIMGFGDEEDGQDFAALHSNLKEMIREYHLGAVIYFPPGGDHEPLEDIRRTTEDLQRSAEIPLLIATDQENGTVARVRVGVTHLPGAMALGAAGDEELWEQVGVATGEQLRAAGIFQTFAPVADLIMVAENPGVNVRSVGSDPEKAARQLAATTRALAKGGVASTLKHFPGYGSAAVDPHLGLPDVSLTREEWEKTERLTFQAAIDAGADSIMLGHVAFTKIDPENAATFSSVIVKDLLRNEMGFEGVIVTDAMDMGGALRPEGKAEACVSALQAGVDQVLMPNDLPEAYRAVLNAVKQGRLSRDDLRESAKRILRLKQKLGLDAPRLPDLTNLDSARHLDIAKSAARRSVTLRDPGSSAELAPGAAVTLIHPGEDPQKRGVNPAEVLRPILETNGHPVSELVWGASEGEVDPGEGLPALPKGAREAVVVLRDAWMSDLPVSGLLQELTESGVTPIVIACRSPYEANTIQESIPVIFTYGDNVHAFEAAGEVLTGKLEARGILPMPVSDSAGPEPSTMSAN